MVSKKFLWIVELERQMKNLTWQIAQLFSLVNIKEFRSVKRLRSISPSTEQLSVWAKQCAPPKDLADDDDNGKEID